MTIPTAAAAAPTPAEPTHPCVRCGAPVPPDIAMCERCNPLGLSQPASSQAHGTVFLGILLAVVALAVLGRLALSGVGPFEARITQILPTSDGLSVTLVVRNAGSNAGSTTCRLTDAGRDGTGPVAFVLSPAIQPAAEATFQTAVRQFGTAALPLAVACESP